MAPRVDPEDVATARQLAERLKQLRTDRGLSQEALAHASGLTRNHYQILEQGITPAGRPTNPRFNTLLALAKALDVTIEDLIK